MRRAALLALSLVLAGAPAAAQARSPREEARERFDRGLRLFNQGDNGGALAEFQRAQELAPHPVLQLNLGLVLAAMGRPVEALRTLDALLAAPGALDAARLGRARAVRAEQATRVATLEVVTAAAGAAVEVDGVAVGAANAPLPVASGVRLITVTAPGHLPARRTVTLPGQALTRVALTLEPLAGEPARITLRTATLDAEVLVDGELVARTPLVTDLALPPGRRRVELRRPGYVTATRTVEVSPGGRGELALALEVDRAALATEAGRLTLAVSEAEAVVFLDDTPAGAGTGPFTVPRGRHRLRVERALFLPFEREVTVPRGGAVHVVVELVPTPEHRLAWRERTTARRTWGWVGAAAGLGVAAGGAGFLLWNGGAITDAEAAFSHEAQRNGDGGDCDPAAGLQTDACRLSLQLALDDLDAARGRTVFGWVGVGAGAAIGGVGLWLLLGNDDPGRYEPRAESDIFAGLRATPTVSLDRRGAALGLIGLF